LWTLIKNKKKDHTGVSPLVDHGITYTDHQDKADLLANYFSIFTAENIEYVPTLSSNPLPDVPSIAINLQGVQYLLSKLQTHKSGALTTSLATFKRSVSRNCSCSNHGLLLIKVFYHLFGSLEQ